MTSSAAGDVDGSLLTATRAALCVALLEDPIIGTTVSSPATTAAAAVAAYADGRVRTGCSRSSDHSPFGGASRLIRRRPSRLRVTATRLAIGPRSNPHQPR